MPTERRLRKDYPDPELAMARVRMARKEYDCHARVIVDSWEADGIHFLRHAPCPTIIRRGDTYVRISETRLPVCQRCAGFTSDDIVEVKRG